MAIEPTSPDVEESKTFRCWTKASTSARDLDKEWIMLLGHDSSDKNLIILEVKAGEMSNSREMLMFYVLKESDVKDKFVFYVRNMGALEESMA